MEVRAAGVCDCGREAVEKVVGPRSPNQGLRYLCCDHFVFFGKKKNCCRFFEWIDQPRITQEQKKEARAGKRQRKEDATVSITALQPANNTESVIRDSKTFAELQVNKENVELETRSVPLQALIHQDVINSVGAQNSTDQDVCMKEASLLRAQTGNGQIEDLSGAEHQHSSPTNGTECKTDIQDTIQPNTQVGQDAMQSRVNVYDISETPNCFCSRAALLKIVKSRGPNHGLRFWVCSNSRPFYVKKKSGIAEDGEESCKFFRFFLKLFLMESFLLLG